MLRSDQINELAAALSAAQGKFPILQKRTKAYNYMYADLAEMIECVQPVLEVNGLSLSSEIDWERAILTMWLFHGSGQHLGCSIKLHYKADGKVNEMQAMGSAISYARRYAISCLLNLAADKESDDDGYKSAPKAEAKEYEKPKAYTAPVAPKEPEKPFVPLSEAQRAELDSLLQLDSDKDYVISSLCERKKVASIYDIDSDYYENTVKKRLNDRIAKASVSL